MDLVVLTATIAPSPVVPQLVRTSVSARLSDYVAAFRATSERFRLDSTHFLICENSGSGTRALEQALLPHASYVIAYEESTAVAAEGKGLGEARMLARVGDHLRNTPIEYSRVIKMTGRLSVTNIARVLNHREPTNPRYMYCRWLSDRSQVDTRFYACSPSFWLDYLCEAHGFVNEARGRFLEHAVARQLSGAIYDGVDWIRMQPHPRYQGFSGSTGRRYGSFYDLSRNSAAAIGGHLVRNWYF